jgi:hypothetical protein
MAEIFNNSDSETEFEGFEVRDINAAEATLHFEYIFFHTKVC